MTKLRERKTRLTFETEAEVKYRGKYRAIVVEPDHEGQTVAIRLKGSRVRYHISWHTIFNQAAASFALRSRQLTSLKRKRVKTVNDWQKIKDLEAQLKF